MSELPPSVVADRVLAKAALASKRLIPQLAQTRAVVLRIAVRRRLGLGEQTTDEAVDAIVATAEFVHLRCGCDVCYLRGRPLVKFTHMQGSMDADGNFSLQREALLIDA